MSFTRTVVARRSNLVFGTGLEEDVIQRPKAIYGTALLGTAMGIIKSATFTDLGNKAVLTNNTVPDTIVYTGLGIEATYEVAIKSTAAKPFKGQLMLLPGPVSAGLADMVVVVDEFDDKFEEEGYRMGTIKATHHAGLMDNEAAADADTELLSSNWNGLTLDGSPQAQPQTALGIANNA